MDPLPYEMGGAGGNRSPSDVGGLPGGTPAGDAGGHGRGAATGTAAVGVRSPGDAQAPGTLRGVDGWRDTMKAAEPIRAGTRILAVMDREGARWRGLTCAVRRRGGICWCGRATTTR